MSNRHSSGNRDRNEPLFTELLRRAGVAYNLAPEGHGLDIYVFLPGRVECWEIKNPAVRKCDRQLTDAERKMQSLCGELDVPYFVFEHVEQAAERLNVVVQPADEALHGEHNPRYKEFIRS